MRETSNKSENDSSRETRNDLRGTSAKYNNERSELKNDFERKIICEERAVNRN